MVRTFFDIKEEEKNNPRPKDLGEDEHWNPISPRREVIQAYAEAKHDYEKTVHDRACDNWYELVHDRPEKITMEVPQTYRIKIPNDAEYVFYNVTLRGEDWKGNEHDISIIKGRYSKPLFRTERDPSSNKVTSSQINDHKTVYDIKWSKEKFDELMQSAVDPISMIVYGSANRRIGIHSIDDYRNGSIEDLIQSGMKGKSLETVLAERNQFVYEKREKRLEMKQEKST